VLRRLVLAVAALLLPLLLTACNTGNAPLGLLGKPAPSLNLPGHPLASLRGRPIVLNFWASWCAPCLLEFPSLEALQRQLPGVTVLAVSFDRDPRAYARFLRQHQITVRTALDTSGRSNQAFGTTEPPETYILDSHGIVRRRFIGAQDWTDPEIESYLRALE
jgi:cytochrome c biogenesis protein CcmG/thiol:disulfide interchange protein DsbE